MATLFDDITMGHLTLPNRIAMAPLTRNRADREGVPGPSAATYHAQRASAAVIITEGSQPSAAGQGFVRTPGLHSTEQLRAWRTVTDAVHAADGRIFAQIMHTGRIGHPDLVRHSSLPAGFVPLAPSAIRPTNGTAQTYARSGRPRAGTRPHRPRSSRRPAARRARGRSAWSSAYRRRGRRYGDAISSSPDRCTFMFESIRRRNLDLLTWEVHLSSYQLPAAVTTCGFGSEGPALETAAAEAVVVVVGGCADRHDRVFRPTPRIARTMRQKIDIEPPLERVIRTRRGPWPVPLTMEPFGTLSRALMDSPEMTYCHTDSSMDSQSRTPLLTCGPPDSLGPEKWRKARWCRSIPTAAGPMPAGPRRPPWRSGTRS
ncbi:hypothetical protein ACIOJE_17850 [Kitasatospora sp. NPDC087861]|uniref:oxidoreductase n=1 Tax=Kitasatospora sp. NPDC087861 TaxID=3364070 RepID=UPI0037F4A26D